MRRKVTITDLTDEKQVAYLIRLLEDLFLIADELTVVTTDPNGSQEGRKGKSVLFDDTAVSGNFFISINTDGGTVWKKVQVS